MNSTVMDYQYWLRPTGMAAGNKEEDMTWLRMSSCMLDKFKRRKMEQWANKYCVPATRMLQGALSLQRLQSNT